VHSVDQRPTLRHLCESLEGTEGLIETVGFKKTTESMWWRTSANVSREWVPQYTAIIYSKNILTNWHLLVLIIMLWCRHIIVSKWLNWVTSCHIVNTLDKALTWNVY